MPERQITNHTYHWMKLTATAPTVQKPLFRIVDLEGLDAGVFDGCGTWGWRRNAVKDNFCSALLKIVSK